VFDNQTWSRVPAERLARQHLRVVGRALAVDQEGGIAVVPRSGASDAA